MHAHMAECRSQACASVSSHSDALRTLHSDPDTSAPDLSPQVPVHLGSSTGEPRPYGFPYGRISKRVSPLGCCSHSAPPPTSHRVPCTVKGGCQAVGQSFSGKSAALLLVQLAIGLTPAPWWVGGVSLMSTEADDLFMYFSAFGQSSFVKDLFGSGGCLSCHWGCVCVLPTRSLSVKWVTHIVSPMSSFSRASW